MRGYRPGRHRPLAKMSRMPGFDLSGDPPACPLLGLALDHRTRYTFPHPAHRCHAAGSAKKIQLGHQSVVCLGASFATCERYQSWEHRLVARRSSGRPKTAGPAPGPAEGPVTDAQPHSPTVIHVVRAGDTLDRIAAAHGIMPEAIAAANALVSPAVLTAGQRLVIPRVGPTEADLARQP